MELNQLLQQLLTQAGTRSPGDAQQLLARLAKLPPTEVLLNLKSAAGGSANQQSPAAHLQLTVAVAGSQAKAGAPGSSTQPIQLTLTPAQVRQVQTLQLAAANTQMAVKPADNAQRFILQLTPVPANAGKAVNLELPLSQLPRALQQTLVASARQPAAAASGAVTARPGNPPLQDVSNRLPPRILLQQMPPAQLRQALTQQINSQPAQPPQQALARVLQAVQQQLPTSEGMQQPQQLKQWLNDWFAAKPVSANNQQQMGGLGKMLMMLLSFALQQPRAEGSTTAAQASAPQSSLNNLTQALLDQLLRPAPRQGAEATFSAEVRERINQALQQLPGATLQRLMQLFTAAVNNAQVSQARLADSAPAQPEYYVLLPASAENPEQQHELLIRREPEGAAGQDEGRSVWLFTLRFDTQLLGPLLVKGRYHAAGSRVDFYTQSEPAQIKLQQQLGRLQQRFEELQVGNLNLSVQQGKVPDTLAQQQSGIIRVTV
ncbi:hypothetical protein LG288_03310 [Idiomarina seosinensis]|uniref:hypothetical protein n=1 Tax=Idiomarina seosinensis TaxID=281739 RepID=UPI0038513C2A